MSKEEFEMTKLRYTVEVRRTAYREIQVIAESEQAAIEAAVAEELKPGFWEGPDRHEFDFAVVDAVEP